MEQEYTDILYEKGDGVAKVTINRPQVRNAFRPLTIDEMVRAFQDAREDDTVGVIVLTGEGQGFCSGADMRRDNDPSVLGENFVGNRDHTESPDFTRQHFFHGFTQLHRDISLIRKPTIAMINGAAVGSGTAEEPDPEPLFELEEEGEEGVEGAELGPAAVYAGAGALRGG